MSWNKDNPRFRRSPVAGRVRKRKGFFTRLGQRLDFWWRKLSGQSAGAPAARLKAHRPLPPAPVELFDDLQIATPKPRAVCPPPKKPAPAGEAGTPAESPTNASRPFRKKTRPCAPGEKAAPPRPEAPAAPPESAPPAPETPAAAEVPPVQAVEEILPPAPEAPAPAEVPPVQAVEEILPPAPEAPAPAALTPDTPAGPTPDRPSRPGPPRKKKPRPLTPAPLTPREAAEKFGFSEKPAEPHRPRPDSPPTPRPCPPPERRRLPRRPALIAAGLVFLAVAAGIVYYVNSRTAPTAKVARIPAASLPKVAPLTPGLFETLARQWDEAVKTEVTISAGSSLGKALEALGVGARNHSQALIDRLNADDALGGLVRPGAVVRAFWNDRDKTELKRLEYHPDGGGAPLVVNPKADGGFWLYSLATPPLRVEAAREGIVESSLWEAGSKIGLDPNLIMNLADILASEIDFLTDIKAGATFQVLFSRDYQDGRPVGTPVIDMVRMTNKGQEYEFYRYVNSQGKSGYFDPKGRSNMKTFFVSPLQYKRISSNFTMARRHPIFKTVRPHQGVDYAAPSGTPVSSVADGTVVFCGWNGGFGKLVTVKHDETYTTMYAHLSRFAPGLKKGSVVKQGDLVGNVGATGTATGPHLDFRLKKNGVFIDPIPELAKQQGKLLEAAEAQAFTQVVTRYRNRMTFQLANDKS